MIEEIKSIYIIDSKGNPFFVKELFTQDSENAEAVLLSNFIAALQTFASELGGKQAKIIKLGESKIFTLIDNLTKLYFVIKAKRDAKEKKILDILKKIKNLFINKFTGHLTDSEENKREIMKEFIPELDEILEPQDRVQEFLGNL
ncbi:MAG: hypothetical protein EU544_05545 [Promethearchaeota archaeon]|nr:MAG: hypothetical protein EU544_05545 [Candidatus Lokiarchaeota archaeon]